MEKSGVVLNPATPIDTIKHVLPELDLVLIMSVNPGFGGQSFIQESLSKIKELRTLIDEKGLDVEIEVDGGVNAETARLCEKAGATVLVAGSAIYGKKDIKGAIQAIRGV